jgi:RES domain-containing protein
MEVYRITRCEFITDLSGIGASQHPGRWNSKGTRMLYTAQSASLAALETVVHIAGLKLSASYCMIVLDIPGDLISSINKQHLPGNWNDYPAPDSLKSIGDNFIKDDTFLALRVPSAVVPEDYNYLINPFHKKISGIKIIRQRPFTFDGRLSQKP